MRSARPTPPPAGLLPASALACPGRPTRQAPEPKPDRRAFLITAGATLALLSFVAALPGAPATGAGTGPQGPTVSEYELKAAILPKLPLFFTWPATSFNDSGSPLKIGILGPDLFGPHLPEAIRNRKPGTRPIALVRCGSVEDAAACHMVILGATPPSELRKILSKLSAHPILTVSDLPGFTEAGGMIGLTREEKRIGLVVNPAAAQQAGLRIDPQLLRIAKVTGAPNTAGSPPIPAPKP